MSYFAVTRNAGPAWTDGKSAFEQPGAGDHAAFMTGLEEAGLVLFAGQLDGTEHGRIRVLLIADTPTEADIRRHLAGDPWEAANRLVTVSVRPWNPFVGARRLSGAPAATS
jgi:uncharacterized protein YciI